MTEALPTAIATSIAPPSVKERLLSLDFFRGLTMFLLIGESTLLYEHLRDPRLAGTLLHALGTQLDHHPWAGLRFWDLVQPFFMFIVGAALAFSAAKRAERGESRATITKHVIIRSITLLVIGWALYCIGPLLAGRAAQRRYFGIVGRGQSVMAGADMRPERWFEGFNEMIGRPQTEAWNQFFHGEQ